MLQIEAWLSGEKVKRIEPLRTGNIRAVKRQKNGCLLAGKAGLRAVHEKDQ